MSARVKKRSCEWCGGLFHPYRVALRFCGNSCAMFARNHRRGGDEPIGTRKQSPNGYVMVKCQSKPSKWRQEHRIVMEDVLGRKVAARERIHHKNGVRNDNRPENLELWTLDHKDPPGVRAKDIAGPSCWVSGLLSQGAA